MKRTRLMAGFAVLGIWTSIPEASMACDHCFGVGIDDPVVAAVSSSMFALLMMTVVVFSGVLSFFKNVIENEVALEDGQCRPAPPQSSDSQPAGSQYYGSQSE